MSRESIRRHAGCVHTFISNSVFVIIKILDVVAAIGSIGNCPALGRKNELVYSRSVTSKLRLPITNFFNSMASPALRILLTDSGDRHIRRPRQKSVR